jgi:transposase-like protein
MQSKIKGDVKSVKQFLDELKREVVKGVIWHIEAQLEADVEAWLHRGYHERRQGITRRSHARCQRCGTQAARAFSRNGHRQRQMVTTYGVLSFWLPRVVCECGGSVTIPFSMLQPYQRLWDDVVAQGVRWAEVGLSLRQMQTAIGDQLATQIGLRKLNQITQAVELPSAIELTSVPPIILLDAIWVTLLADTQTTQPDRLQRQRQVKAKQKVCVVVALGLYPQSGRWGILGWHVDHAESQAAWEALLLPLEQRGLYRQRGVELFIHDGGKGLIAALDLLYPTVPHQRCVFHKLRNLWHSIQTPAGLTPDQRRQLRLEILQPAQAIFYAASEKDAVGIQHALIEQFQHTQPQFVATLQRDWHDTIAFFRVLRRFPDWQRTALRTTSLLERVNRMLRRLFRPKGSFHSVTGLLSTVSRVLNPLRLF